MNLKANTVHVTIIQCQCRQYRDIRDTGDGNWEKNATNQHNKNASPDSLHSSTQFIVFEMSFRCLCHCGVTQGGSKQFPALSKTQILMGHHYHSLSVDATIMVSKNCQIIGEHVGIIFMAQQVTIATLWPVKNTLYFSFTTIFVDT